MSRTIYLCGPINGRTDDDASNWRNEVKTIYGMNGIVLDPMRRDYRGRELEPGIASEIVDGDMEDILSCDAVLVYFDKPSVGTAMEVFFAKYVLGKVVVLIDASDKPLSPWLLHHTDYRTRSISDALMHIDMAINLRPYAGVIPAGSTKPAEKQI